MVCVFIARDNPSFSSVHSVAHVLYFVISGYISKTFKDTVKTRKIPFLSLFNFFFFFDVHSKY